LEYLAEAGREVGLPIITEVMRIDQLDRVAASPIACRSAPQHAELRPAERGRPRRKAVMLKRGMSATWRNSWPRPSTSSWRATPMSSCASAASARSNAPYGIPWTWGGSLFAPGDPPARHRGPEPRPGRRDLVIPWPKRRSSSRRGGDGGGASEPARPLRRPSISRPSGLHATHAGVRAALAARIPSA